jgi:hypothetical protein
MRILGTAEAANSVASQLRTGDGCIAKGKFLSPSGFQLENLDGETGDLVDWLQARLDSS